MLLVLPMQIGTQGTAFHLSCDYCAINCAQNKSAWQRKWFLPRRFLLEKQRYWLLLEGTSTFFLGAYQSISVIFIRSCCFCVAISWVSMTSSEISWISNLFSQQIVITLGGFWQLQWRIIKVGKLFRTTSTYHIRPHFISWAHPVKPTNSTRNLEKKDPEDDVLCWI